jgi:alpha-tubulin suppressor-like RCC1 family protein
MRRFRSVGLCLIAASALSGAVSADASATSYSAAAWGSNNFGELGDGTMTNRDVPVMVDSLGEVTAVSGGFGFSLALLSDGTVMAWGRGEAGRLGDGSTANSDVPVAVSGLTGVTAIAAGNSHGLALLSNGTVMAWGGDGFDQLGDGKTTNRDVPAPVPGLSGVTAIAAGGEHSLALLSDGTVMAWGSDGNGELGNGTTGVSSPPVAVSGLSGVTAVQAGDNHDLALMDDGTLKAWGGDLFGQLGDGANSTSTVPVAVSGVAGATAIAAGGDHSSAILADGSVMAWGRNRSGQLGDGTTTDRNAPVAVSGLSGVKAVAAGEQFSLALLTSNAVMAWGENSQGQLGDQTLTKRTTPVAVSACGLSETVGISAGGSQSLAYGVLGDPCPLRPLVTAVSPSRGPTAGGTSVTVKGIEFAGTTSVMFGATSAVSFTVGSSTSISAISPPGAGTVDVTVTTPEGTSATGAGDQFTYLPIPAVASVSPSSGPEAGGTTVAIGGSEFTGSSSVTFGGSSAASFTVNSATSITAVSPPGMRSVDIRVTTPEGTSAPVAADRFRYERTETAGPPEFGRCIKVSAKTGGFSNAGCTKKAAGSYAWMPGVAKRGFTSSAGATTLETVKGTKVLCTAEAGKGEYLGLKLIGNVVLKFSGCTSQGGECTSVGGHSREVVTNPLEGVLGIRKATATPRLALQLFPSGFEPVAEFSCLGGTTFVVRGAVTVPVVSNKMQLTSALKFAARRGRQKPEGFEGGPREILETSINRSPFEQAGLSSDVQQASEEPVEINSVV